MSEKTDVKLIIRNMLNRVEDWKDLADKESKNEQVAVPHTNKDGYTFYLYEQPNPGRIAMEVQQKIAQMDPETRRLVFEEINKMQQKEIDDGKSKSDEVVKACGILDYWKEMVERNEKASRTKEATDSEDTPTA